MRDWALVYERPSLNLDALFLAAALAIHLPLLGLHLRASKGGAKARAERLVNIDIIEERARQLKEKPSALPPKVVSKVDDVAQKMAEAKKKLLERKAPKPVPLPPKPTEQALKMQDPAKILMENKARMAEVAKPQLKDGKTFTEKVGQLKGAEGAKEIKMGGGVTAIQMGSKPSPLTGKPGGPALAGKSGFAVAEKAMPMGIGGGDGDLKMGGGPAIVVPVGKRGKADGNILSTVATIKDRGALKNGTGGAGGEGLGGAPGPSSGLALGPGGKGSAIAVAGRPGSAASAGPVALVASGKTFSEKTSSAQASAPAGGLSGTSGGSSLPSVNALARRPGRPARNMFQITGPLQNRSIVSRVIPPYPAWAQAKGIEASVTLQLTVSPDGEVRSTILVLRTSGYPQLDQSAVDSLRQWRFGPLPPDQQRDEVGTITFQFSVQ